MSFNGWAVRLNDVILTGGEDGTQSAFDADCPDTGVLVLGCALDEPPSGLGLPDLRTQDVTYAQRDGVEHFSDWYLPRILTLPSVTLCPGCGCGPDDQSGLTAREAAKRVTMAWDRQCGDTELVIYTDCHDPDADAEDRVVNGPFGIIGRPRVASREWHGPSKCATMLLRFDAVDQRMYVLDGCGTPGSGQVCETVLPSTSQSGLCFTGGPDSDAACFTGGPDSDAACFDTPLGTVQPDSVITVLGDVCPYVTVTLTGQLTAPITLTNVTTGVRVDYLGSVGASEEPVVIDLANGTATQGGVSRTGLVSGTMALDLGENTIALESGGLSDSGFADVCFRPTVISA